MRCNVMYRRRRYTRGTRPRRSSWRERPSTSTWSQSTPRSLEERCKNGKALETPSGSCRLLACTNGPTRVEAHCRTRALESRFCQRRKVKVHARTTCGCGVGCGECRGRVGTRVECGLAEWEVRFAMHHLGMLSSGHRSAWA